MDLDYLNTTQTIILKDYTVDVYLLIMKEPHKDLTPQTVFYSTIMYNLYVFINILHDNRCVS
jgi:hypothetical protein